MGSSKKKDKRKRKKHHSDEQSPQRSTINDEENQHRYDKYNKNNYALPGRDVPQTEEYIYDISGQEMVTEICDKSKRHDHGDQPSPANRKRHSATTSSTRDSVKSKKETNNRSSTSIGDKEDYKSVPASNDGSTMSIEETNKLRLQLGLKPLKVGQEEKANSYEDREDVHRPALNIADRANADKIREKMEAIREKRRINQKLKKTVGLAEEDDPVLDSAAAWVAKSRLQEKEKNMAARRELMLQEMDEEFGISSLIEETVGNIKQEPSYTSKDLKGLRVQHKGSALQDGTAMVLTLEDKRILDSNQEDVLINVNVLDKEKALKNLENRRTKPGYKAYDEVDDETGMLKVHGVLEKYNEETEVIKKPSFILGGEGEVINDSDGDLERIRASLKSQQVSLEMTAPRLARDYFTEEEMVKFKRPRKKIRKVRKREILKADDLLKLNQDIIEDRGSRSQKASTANELMGDGNKKECKLIDKASAPDELDYFVAVSRHEDPVLEQDDQEAEQELQLALERSRRIKQRKGNDEEQPDHILEKVANEVLNKHTGRYNEEEELLTLKSKRKGKGLIVLDSTSEFCRTLGELPTVDIATKRTEPMLEDEPEVTSSKVATSGRWEQVEYKKEDDTLQLKEEVEEDVLESEPIPTGIAATLDLANMKGYLREGKEKVRKFDPLNLPETKAEVDYEKLRDEEKSKYSRGYDRDRDRYDPYAFKDKHNYKPDFKLEYVDNKGRQLNQKEAFRLLSHKFHGKGSGKLKTEKRAKKLLEEKKLQKMSSIDTPLNTASMFKEKQKQSQSAYLVLSGGGKNLLSGDTLQK